MPLGQLEAISSHTALVGLNCGLAFVLSVITGGEEHTLIAGGFFVLAHTAGLCLRNC